MVGTNYIVREGGLHENSATLQVGPEACADSKLHVGGCGGLAQGLLGLVRDVRHRRVPGDHRRRQLVPRRIHSQ